jgi:hypothetical protein
MADFRALRRVIPWPAGIALLLWLSGTSCDTTVQPTDFEYVSTYTLVGEAPQKQAGSAPGAIEVLAPTMLDRRFYDFGIEKIDYKLRSPDVINTSLANASRAYAPDTAYGGSALGTLSISGGRLHSSFAFSYAGALQQPSITVELPLDTAQAALDELVARKFVVGQQIDSDARATGIVHVMGQDEDANPIDLTYTEVFHPHREDYISVM